MFFGVMSKWRGCLGISAFLWLALPSAGWAQQFCAPCAAPAGVSCGISGPSHHCPPAFQYRYEGAPRIHWHRGCPHPICNPCDLPHWGYYETCWNRYPFPPDWTHCPSPPPAAFVNLNPLVNPNMPGQPQRNSFGTPQPAPPMALPPVGTQEEFHQPRRFEEKRPGL